MKFQKCGETGAMLILFIYSYLPYVPPTSVIILFLFCPYINPYDNKGIEKEIEGSSPFIGVRCCLDD